MSNRYLERYAFPRQFISHKPSDQLNIIVTIPCYNEPNLIDSLNAIHNCELPKRECEVIVVINNSENAEDVIKKNNRATYHDAQDWVKFYSNDRLKYHIILVDDLPHKHAGVGLARKIAMDEAVRRFEQIGHTEGIIACFDADSICDNNYLVQLEEHFINHPNSHGCSIYFEHPLEGEFDSEIYEAITDYELFLRYYVNALRFVGIPYAYETIGSSMAVINSAYQKQGGMNRRKAGEDFYFLHRIIALGNFTELNSTRVIPSPRISDRVPFGTGKAVGEWMNKKSLNTYNPLIFIDLKKFISRIDELHSIKMDFINDWIQTLPNSIAGFLVENNFTEQVEEAQNNSGALDKFTKRFFQWFNGFKVLKYVHWARDQYYPNVSVLEASQWLLSEENRFNISNSKEALLKLREIDKSTTYP